MSAELTHDVLLAWIESYERAWRSPGAGAWPLVPALFAATATYLTELYADSVTQEYQDQEYQDPWVLTFGADGLVTRFEEWPFWPGHGRPPSARPRPGPNGPEAASP